MKPPICGAYAALVTPVDEHGKVDYYAFDRLLEFLLSCGVDGFVVGGGTAEYPHFDLEDRKKLALAAALRIAGKASLLVGIGASTVYSTLDLGNCAYEYGCDAVLLPMPHFFHYEQDDLKAFCQTVSRNLKVPCLLYNLPAFTNPLEIETAIQLLREEGNIIGIKDSSGERRNLVRLAQARPYKDFLIFAGDDALAFDALQAGWNGIISGIACFLPEVLVALYSRFRAGDLGAARQAQALLDRLIEEIVKLPIPWGIHLGLEVRGILKAPFHLPLSARRRQQVSCFIEWLGRWLREQNLTLQQARI